VADIAFARRADPERIDQARRVATRNGLTNYGMSVEDAERWCTACKVQAAVPALAIESAGPSATPGSRSSGRHLGQCPEPRRSGRPGRAGRRSAGYRRYRQ